MRKPSKSRKLLIASVGVATINYVAACGGEAATSGNLVAPQGGSSESAGAAGASAGNAGKGGQGGSPTSGNLVAPPAAGATGKGGSGGAPTSGNLVPPPAGTAGEESK